MTVTLSDLAFNMKFYEVKRHFTASSCFYTPKETLVVQKNMRTMIGTLKGGRYVGWCGCEV